MGKKEQYFCLAEKMYVEEQKPVSAIAKALNITNKTLGDWKKEGSWDEKRRCFLSSRYACYTGLYELLNKVTAKAIEEFHETGEIPERSTMNFISKMIDKLPKLKNFEAREITDKIDAALEADAAGENSAKDVNAEVLLSVDKFLRGEG